MGSCWALRLIQIAAGPADCNIGAADKIAGLHRKGLLERERERRTDIYWPALTREEFQRARAQQEVSTLVGEFGEVALVHFAKEMDKLDPARLRKLRRLARGD